MNKRTTLLMGAVAYDPKVVNIWEGFRQYFSQKELDLDYILYSNYEQQVEALLAGHIDVGWNSPLAWLQVECIAKKMGRRAKAICMRDTDRDLTSVIIVKNDSTLNRLSELKDRRIGVGAKDSPQACLIPLNYLANSGLDPNKQIEVVEYDILPGKHGDHIGGERKAAQALVSGTIDAACMIDSNYLAFSLDGSLPSGSVRVLDRTPHYDHCNFTVLEGHCINLIKHFQKLLLEMTYSDPNVRPLLDLEGLKQWLPGRTTGYQQLETAVKRFGTLEPFIRRFDL